MIKHKLNPMIKHLMLSRLMHKDPFKKLSWKDFRSECYGFNFTPREFDDQYDFKDFQFMYFWENGILEIEFNLTVTFEEPREHILDIIDYESEDIRKYFP